MIKIRGEKSGTSVQLYVEDNGIGIPEEGKEKIFYAFQKMHSNHEYEGSGLGLAICKRIIDVHHGSISVSGQINEGSTFVITLPAVKFDG